MQLRVKLISDCYFKPSPHEFLQLAPIRISQRRDYVPHRHINLTSQLLHRYPSFLMSSYISLPPDIVNRHLKNHLYENIIQFRATIILNPHNSVLPIRCYKAAKKSSCHSYPNHVTVRTSEKDMFPSFILLPTQQITQTLIRSPVDRRFFIASQMMKENIGTACVNQTKVLNRLSHTCFLFVPMSY